MKRRAPDGRSERMRRRLVKAFVWVVLAIFALTSVGVALVTFSSQ